MKTTTIAALLALSAGARALALSSSATALELDNSNSDSAEAAKSDISYVLAGGYAHFFATDFDAGGGDVAARVNGKDMIFWRRAYRLPGRSFSNIAKLKGDRGAGS
mgnify:CR=1 FL=1